MIAGNAGKIETSGSDTGAMMSEKQFHRLHAYVEGYVQGVGFRYFVLRSAQEYNLTGWVRNLYDGRVEVMAEGELADLNRLLAALRKGPHSSDVRQLDYSFSEARGDFNRFSVISTG
jgi:acylphosphatase